MAEDVDRLREYLAERDEACPSCGYNLRGLTGQACPECGLGLTLRVGLTEPATGVLIAAIVGLAVGVGWSGTFLGVVVSISLLEQDWPPGYVCAVPALTFIVTGMLLLGVCGRDGRAKFRRRTAAVRLGTCTGAWVLSVGSVVLFVAVVYLAA